MLLLLGVILGGGGGLLSSNFNLELVGASLRDSFALCMVIVASCCYCIEEEKG